jgi:hypothetical protein
VSRRQRAVRVLRETIPATGNVLAEAEKFYAVFVGKLGRVMIVDVAVVLAHAHLPLAGALSLDRVRSFDPVAHVQIVHGLLDQAAGAGPAR